MDDPLKVRAQAVRGELAEMMVIVDNLRMCQQATPEQLYAAKFAFNSIRTALRFNKTQPMLNEVAMRRFEKLIDVL